MYHKNKILEILIKSYTNMILKVLAKTNTQYPMKYLPFSGHIKYQNQSCTIVPQQKSLATHAIDTGNNTFLSNLKKKFGWGDNSKSVISTQIMCMKISLNILIKITANSYVQLSNL